MEPAWEPVLLRQSRIWRGVAVPVTVIVVLAVLAVAYDWVPSWYPMVLSGAVLLLAVARRHTAVFADDVGLLIRRRQQWHRSYAWTDIERIGWRDAGQWGTTLTVFPRGGPYDVPGPNASVDVARLWGGTSRRAPDPLADLRARHGLRSLLEP